MRVFVLTRFLRLFLLLFLLLLPTLGLTGCGSPEFSPVAQPESLPEGEKLFRLHCATCHGLTSGFRNLAQRFPASPHARSVEAFTGFLRNPDVPDMNAFSSAELPDAEIQTLYRWLQQEFQPQEPPNEKAPSS